VRQLDANFAPAAYSLGLLHGNAGEWDQAAQSLAECLAIDPYHPGALYDLAHAYVKLGQGEVAQDVLAKAAVDPRARTEALRALVAVNLELGDAEGAREWAREASRSDPELARDPRMRELLAE
jgi:tetratricopeptide (TPR) repeat protein